MNETHEIGAADAKPPEKNPKTMAHKKLVAAGSMEALPSIWHVNSQLLSSASKRLWHLCCCFCKAIGSTPSTTIEQHIHPKQDFRLLLSWAFGSRCSGYTLKIQNGILQIDLGEHFS